MNSRRSLRERQLEGFFQEIPELHSALISYLDARQRLKEKSRARGFWPVSSGRGKSSKGRSFSKGGSRGKKSGNAKEALLQRIARSHCRLCGEKGHWRAECPKATSGTASSSQRDVPAGVAQAMEALVVSRRQTPKRVSSQVSLTVHSRPPSCMKARFENRKGVCPFTTSMLSHRGRWPFIRRGISILFKLQVQHCEWSPMRSAMPSKRG